MKISTSKDIYIYIYAVANYFLLLNLITLLYSILITSRSGSGIPSQRPQTLLKSLFSRNY